MEALRLTSRVLPIILLVTRTLSPTALVAATAILT